MALTNSQRNTLRAHILATPALAAKAQGPGTDYNGLKDLLNAPSATDAWRTAMPPEDTDEVTPWVNFDNITQAGKRDSWLFAFLKYPRNFTRAKVRKWVTDVWGNATAGSDAEAILLGALEKATAAQVVLGGATRTTGTVSAMDRNWLDLVTVQDLNEMAFG
jgi:hypothetical protein